MCVETAGGEVAVDLGTAGVVLWADRYQDGPVESHADSWHRHVTHTPGMAIDEVIDAIFAVFWSPRRSAEAATLRALESGVYALRISAALSEPRAVRDAVRELQALHGADSHDVWLRGGQPAGPPAKQRSLRTIVESPYFTVTAVDECGHRSGYIGFTASWEWAPRADMREDPAYDPDHQCVVPIGVQIWEHAGTYGPVYGRRVRADAARDILAKPHNV